MENYCATNEVPNKLERKRPSVPTSQISSFTNKDPRIIVQPEQYIAAIDAHSKKDQSRHLHSGVNYRALARFFSSPRYAFLPKKHMTPHDYVVVQTISAKAGSKLHVFKSDECGAFDATPVQEANVCKLIFLRGYPSSQWLGSLGARYRLDPEFLRRHFEFSPSIDCYDLPALPSASRRNITLRVTTIYKRKLALSASAVRSAREDEMQTLRKHQLSLGMSGLAGESIIRRLSFHNETYYSVEQAMTICGKKRNGGWRAFVWLDAGLPIQDQFSAQGPVAGRSTLATDAECTPVIQHQPKVALRTHETSSSANPGPSWSGAPTSASSSAVLPYQYGTSLDSLVMPTDLMYSLSELFSFAAHSESQFLNLLQRQIGETTNCSREDMEHAVDDIKYMRSLLEDHEQYLVEVARCIKDGGDPKWPSATESAQTAVIVETREELLTDYEHLVNRCKALRARCTEGATMIANGAMLEESRKAIDQAKRVSRLTLLAFFFLPLSFATSLFGMNFEQFGQGKLSIWLFPLVLIPIVTVSIMLSFWESMTKIRWRSRKDSEQQEKVSSK